MTIKISKMHRRISQSAIERQQDDKLRTLMNSTTELQVNTFWDDAAAAYESIQSGYRHAVSDTAAKVKDFLEKNKDAISQDTTLRLHRLVTQLTIDTQRFFSRVEELHAQHAGRTGSTKGYDDHNLLVQIEVGYHDAVGVYNASAGEISGQIYEIIGLAQQAREADRLAQEAFALQQAQDPNVVTDVEIKTVEVKPE